MPEQETTPIDLPPPTEVRANTCSIENPREVNVEEVSGSVVFASRSWLADAAEMPPGKLWATMTWIGLGLCGGIGTAWIATTTIIDAARWLVGR